MKMSPFTKFLLLAATALVKANPTPPAECTELHQRKPWHILSDTEKQEYIDAELCLMDIDAPSGLPASRTRFDELQENHQIQASIVHFVGAFLPYHRYLMWTHEHLLRTECGYKGAQPYWHEQMDAGQFTESIVFDPVLGFGGDGQESDGCITDGPFANYTNVLGPGFTNTEHCITRNISDARSEGSEQVNIDACYEYSTFEEAWPCIEGLPHSGGHGGVGGQMQNPISSPGDPTFYLHHTWLDKVWWDWQAGDLSSRLHDISGRNEAVGSFLGVPGGTPPPEGSENIKPEGDPGEITTLTHLLDMMGIVPDVTIEEVMDIRGDLLCYEYVEP